jgi:hypothetical protein
MLQPSKRGFKLLVLFGDARPVGVGVPPAHVERAFLVQQPAFARPGVRDRVDHQHLVAGGHGGPDRFQILVDGVGRVDLERVEIELVGVERRRMVLGVDDRDALAHAGGDLQR